MFKSLILILLDIEKIISQYFDYFILKLAKEFKDNDNIKR
jgi:hypothetical protein